LLVAAGCCHDPPIGREGNPFGSCWDVELPLDAAVLLIQQTDLAEVARRDPAVRGQGHGSHVRREGRDHFAPAQSPRVPEFDRAIIFGGRHE